MAKVVREVVPAGEVSSASIVWYREFIPLEFSVIVGPLYVFVEFDKGWSSITEEGKKVFTVQETLSFGDSAEME